MVKILVKLALIAGCNLLFIKIMNTVLDVSILSFDVISFIILMIVTSFVIFKWNDRIEDWIKCEDDKIQKENGYKPREKALFIDPFTGRKSWR